MIALYECWWIQVVRCQVLHGYKNMQKSWTDGDPVTNVNITIATTKCEKVMQQVYVNISCNDLELEYR